MTNFFQWLDDQGYSYQILNQPKRNSRRGAQVRITHNGNVVDCWPGTSKEVVRHVSAGAYFEGLSLNGVARVIENRPSEVDGKRRRKKKTKGEL